MGIPKRPLFALVFAAAVCAPGARAAVPSTPQLVADINPAGSSIPALPFHFDGRMFFVANDGTTGRELWATDGTAEGTELVADLNPGAASSNPHDFFAWNDRIWFSATGAATGGPELFSGDGTPEGTALFMDIHPSGGSDPGGFRAYDGKLYFAAADAEQGRELWSTSGSVDGTMRRSELRSGANDSNPSLLTVVGDEATSGGAKLVFVARATGVGTALYTLNSSGAPVLLKDINPERSPGIEEMVLLDKQAIFNADDETHGNEIWRSNGTDAGTAMVAEVDTVNDGPGDDPPGSNPTGLTPFKGFVYFSASDGSEFGTELYRANASSVALVRDIKTGQGDGDPAEFRVAGDRLFFAASNNSFGRELWSTDGTTTEAVANIHPTGHSNPSNLVPFGRFVAFVADDGTHGRQLWISDGTATNTLRTTSFPGNAAIVPLGAIGDVFLFSAADGVSGAELWKIEYDVTHPECVEIVPEVQGSPDATQIDFAVVFSEPVEGFTAADDVIVTHNGTSHQTVTVTPVDPANYTVTVAGIAGTGNFTIKVSTTSNVQDLNGNPLIASATSPAVSLDSTAPDTACTTPAHQLAGLLTITISKKDGTGSDLTSLDVFARRDLDEAWTQIGNDVFDSMQWAPPASGRYYFATVGTDLAGNFEAPPTGVGDSHTVYNFIANGSVVFKPVAGESLTVPMSENARVLLDFRDAMPQGNAIVTRSVPGVPPPTGLDPAVLIDETMTIAGTFTGKMTMQWTYDPASDDTIGEAVVDTVFKFAEGTTTFRPAAASGTTLTISGVATFGDFFAGPRQGAGREEWRIR